MNSPTAERVSESSREKNRAIDSCLVPCNRAIGASHRVIFFPWAGAGVRPLKQIFKNMGRNVEVLGVLLPGRETRFREQEAIDIDSLLKHVAAELHQLPPLPLVIGGHSMGGRLAVEFAAHLQNVYRIPVERVIVSGAQAPGAHYTDGYTRCHGMSSEKELLDDILEVGGTPKEIIEDPEICRMVLHTIRTDYQLLDHLASRHCPTVHCPMDVFAAHGDVTTCETSVAAWEEHTDSDFKLHWFYGEHFYLGMYPEPFLAEVKKIIHTEEVI